MSESAIDTARQAMRPRALETEMPSGRTTGWWGMILFVTTEATVFAALFGSYFYVRFQSGGQWPPPGIEPPGLLRPIIMSVLLLPSSLPVMWAERGIRKGQRWRLRAGLAITLVLGIAFLGMQVLEYSSELKKYTFTTNAYGSLFYSITTFHGFHVTVGLIMVGWLLAASLRGSFGYKRHERVRLTAIYWHFVDIVWAAIVLCLYLSPRL
ncbi:heme-copper oxidase subunit III [Dactylosporangium aurantiacum]|uniref:cytochrome-c oxidase n=1 Tax=Dactylosporangium aurantiacum TaxID=35754 RepID=A0A9Q9IM32_9ACTN|nr:heme-copper oxidase subunit III [Dactylosporangium aurantiacum]MDG6110201.1 heme-copper oxidase subunit III [Dactylosporangium aurantiacum]UWZ58652.1 heme-copper oxidase subunit III [Dactylosporangium aurantiacum]